MHVHTQFITRRLLSFFGLSAAVVFVGCSTLPLPRSPVDSLLVVLSARGNTAASLDVVSDRVVIDGPTTVSFDLTKTRSGVFIFRVAPGRYHVASRSLRWKDGSRRRVTQMRRATVEVAASTIVLPKWEFAEAHQGDRVGADSTVSVTPADRRRAARALKDYVRLAAWAGRRVSGFAPYSPFSNYVNTHYTVRIESTPQGAEVVVDGRTWGITPLPVNLAPGKHFIRLRRQGYQPRTAFIDVGGNGTEKFILQAAAAFTPPEARDKTPVMIQPFDNLSSRSFDNLGGVLTDSLSVALKRAGLEIVEGERISPSSGRSSKTTPDFAAAEKAGALVLVAGDYAANNDSILIHAALYDTRTHLVKASVLFRGAGGINIFDSIDRMSGKLGSAVKKALPQVGTAVVQERVISPEAIVFNSRANEKTVIRKRNERKYSLTLGPSVVGVFDEISDPSNSSNRTPRINGPSVGLYTGLDLPISGPVTFHLATAPFIYTDAARNRKIDLPLYAEVRYNFPGFMSDVYLGLQGALHFAPASAVEFYQGGNSSGPTISTVGPFWLAGLNFETGVRIYTYQRLSSLPTFIGFGLTLGFFGYRFDLNLANPTPYPMEIGMRVYWGTRL